MAKKNNTIETAKTTILNAFGIETEKQRKSRKRKEFAVTAIATVATALPVGIEILNEYKYMRATEEQAAKYEKDENGVTRLTQPNTTTPEPASASAPAEPTESTEPAESAEPAEPTVFIPMEIEELTTLMTYLKFITNEEVFNKFLEMTTFTKFDLEGNLAKIYSFVKDLSQQEIIIDSTMKDILVGDIARTIIKVRCSGKDYLQALSHVLNLNESFGPAVKSISK